MRKERARLPKLRSLNARRGRSQTISPEVERFFDYSNTRVLTEQEWTAEVNAIFDLVTRQIVRTVDSGTTRHKAMGNDLRELEAAFTARRIKHTMAETKELRARALRWKVAAFVSTSPTVKSIRRLHDARHLLDRRMKEWIKSEKRLVDVLRHLLYWHRLPSWFR